MSRVRPIQADELMAFAATATATEHVADVAAYAAGCFDQGAMRLEWCFVAECDGRAVGRVGLWTLPSLDSPASIVLLDADDEEEAVALIRHAVQVAREAGSKTLDHVVDRPPQAPQWQTEPERRERRLGAQGFALRRATDRWELDPVTAVPPQHSGRLTYRALGGVGDEALLDATIRVSADALDRYTRSERSRLGPEGEARQMLDDLRAMEYRPEWWELGYDHAGRLVGLVLPAVAPSMGTIAYIGVVPERRGHRYVDDLLARGTRTLLAGTSKVIRADTDTENAPMAAAFMRAGYRHFASRAEFQLRL